MRPNVTRSGDRNEPAAGAPAPCPLDSFTLRAEAEELHRELVGARIQEARQAAPLALCLQLRQPGRSVYLLLSAEASAPRIHQVSDMAGGSAASALCAAMRRQLVGGTVTSIRQRGWDRVFDIAVRRSAMGGPTTDVTLVAELIGRWSNIILVGANGRVVEAAKHVTHRINRVREILPGRPYAPPPPQAGRIDPTSGELRDWLESLPATDSDDFASSLFRQVAGISPFLAREIALRADSTAGEALAELRARAVEETLAQPLAPTLLRDSRGMPAAAYPFRPLQWEGLPCEPIDSIDAALEQVGGAAAERMRIGDAAGRIRAALERKADWIERRIRAAEAARAEGDAAERYRQTGELITANLWRIPAGAAEIEVEDYSAPDSPLRRIVFDPMRTPQAEAEAWFVRARKAETAAAMAAAARADLARQRGAAADLLARLERAESGGDAREMEALERECGPASGPAEPAAKQKPGREAAFAGFKVRRFTTDEGFEIFMGETADANDYLTTRLSAPDDIWLHVRAAASAHVVIRTKGHPESVPQGVLEQAALLCARNSAQKHSSLVAVDYTLRKFVRKPRGAAPGSVQVQREKTLHVTP
jgi:predicted ribosome quality control (RQC) complex YloA/Tae2 family protein